MVKRAGIVLKVNRVSNALFPINAHIEQPNFKVYLSDIGLLCQKSNIPVNIILNKDKMFDNIKGMLAENYVAQQLKTNIKDLFYYEPNQYNEIDFLFQDLNGLVVPIEVKSGKRTKSTSLENYMKNQKVRFGIRISAKNFGFDNGIKSVPLYAVCLINNT